MKKNNSFTGNLLRCAAVVLLTALMFFSNSVKAYSNNSDMVPYTVKSGTYKLSVPSMYDVLIKGQDVSEETASSHGVTQGQLSAYISLSFDELIAVSKDEPMSDCDTIRLKIKEDSYPEIGSLNDYSTFEKRLIADALLSGMVTSDSYELYETDEICFIVFEYGLINPQLRYATIIDGDMIYLYYDAARTGEINEEIEVKLKEIADTFSYEG